MEIGIKIKSVLEKLAKQFNRLQKRQRTLVLLLIASILFSIYLNGVYKPQSVVLRRAKKELINVNNRLLRLKSEIPDINKEEDALNATKRELALLQEQLASLESQLPTQRSIPQLLGELVRKASGYSIDFISIRPKTSKKKKEYPELIIEMKFNSSYSDFANYLNQLESTSRFLEANAVMIEEMKNGFSGVSSVTLTLATLFGESGKSLEKVKEVPSPAPLAIKRNPFLSTFRPQKKEIKKEALDVTGIISTGKQPTAIINDEVYKIGDMVGDKEVKQILPNMVILKIGKKSTVLTLEQD